MSKKIKKLIKQTRRQLQWRVSEITQPGLDTHYITSDPWQRTHIIYSPDNQVRDIEVLHEYGHAFLCETVNPLLSTHYFRPDPGKETLDLISPAARAANDWFVDDWLFQLVPELERKEINEHLDMLMALPESHVVGHPEIITGLALMTAQGIRYCGRKMKLTGILRQAVDALLMVDSRKPDNQSIAEAVNGLLACYCPVWLYLVMDESGIWCWAVKSHEKHADGR